MAQLPDFQPPQPFGCLSADHQSVGSSAQPAAEIFLTPPYCHHGEVLHVQQTRLDLVRSQYRLEKLCHIIRSYEIVFTVA